MATIKHFFQALSLRLFGEEHAGPGYFDPEVRYFSAGLTIEDRARRVG